jgi:hypothetical protein
MSTNKREAKQERGSPFSNDPIFHWKEETTMAFQAQGVFAQVADASRDVVLGMLNDPALWNEAMITKTLRRLGGSAYNIQDVQLIIKDYLSVLAETIRKGETF